MAVETFRFKFDGESVRDGSIDVRDFAPAALAVGQLVEEANRVLNADRSSVAVRLKADFKTSSFETYVEVGVSLYEQAKALFGGEIKDAKDILQALGFWVQVVGGTGLTSGGLWGLLKALRGRRPRKGKLLEQGRVLLELPDGETVETSREVADLYNDTRVLQAAREVVRPLERDGISDLSFSRPGAEEVETSKIERSDVPAVAAPVDTPEDAEVLLSSEYEKSGVST